MAIVFVPRRRRWRMRRVLAASVVLAFSFAGILTGNSIAGASSTGWSTPHTIDPGDVSGGLNSISCASATFCVAVDGDGDGVGNALTYNGHHWSTVSIDPHGGGINSVSCISSHFCAAVDAKGDALTYKGGKWSAPMKIDPAATGGTNEVSCASASFCVAFETNGDALTYNGRKWTAPNNINPNSLGDNAVSCPSARTCIAFGSDEGELIYSNDQWGGASYGGSGASTAIEVSISCPSVSFCMAVDADGKAAAYQDGRWSPVTTMGGSVGVYVSCGAAGECVAVDGKDQAVTYENGGWSAPSNIDPNGDGINSISCPTATFCAAVDSNGDVLYYTHTVLRSSPSHGTPSNQIQFESTSRCTSFERSALLDATTKITVSGKNQNNVTNTWTTTDHPGGAFKTSNWWWWGVVTVTLHPTGRAPISFDAYLPAAKKSALVQVTGNTVVVTCLGSRGPHTTVILPDLASGHDAGCVRNSDPNGDYKLEKTYTGYFYYDNGRYINGSITDYSKTPGSFATVRNLLGKIYDVPLDAVIGVKTACYST
jgi:hypothetical protein